MNLLLTVQYDGTAYAGWQKQPRQRTIQSSLEKAVKRLFRLQRISSVAAGRTDQGVHAFAQRVSLSFDHGRAYPLKKIPLALNALLPYDISVLSARYVGGGFNARFNAKHKTYEYVIWNKPYRSVWHQGVAWHVPQPLDTKAMRQALLALVGTHDYSAFYASGGTQQDTVVRLSDARLRSSAAGVIRISFTADRFLYKMVRNMVGTLVQVGLGRQPVEWVRRVLASGDRRTAGVTAPACGLFLKKIVY